jgi:hypothetical protein
MGHCMMIWAQGRQVRKIIAPAISSRDNMVAVHDDIEMADHALAAISILGSILCRAAADRLMPGF